jgi:hypothetical protein
MDKFLSPEEQKRKREEDMKKRNASVIRSYGLMPKSAEPPPLAPTPRMDRTKREAKLAEWDRMRFAKEIEEAVEELTKEKIDE